VGGVVELAFLNNSASFADEVMNAQRDVGRTAYRSVLIACLTLLLAQLIAQFFLHFRIRFLPYQIALELISLPRVITGWSGWTLNCVVLLAAPHMRGLRVPLLLFPFSIVRSCGPRASRERQPGMHPKRLLEQMLRKLDRRDRVESTALLSLDQTTPMEY
jgi:hypothetical protein